MDLDARVSKHARAIDGPCVTGGALGDQQATAFASGGCAGLQDSGAESVPSVSPRASAITPPYLPG
jgi:hypothetical protein